MHRGRCAVGATCVLAVALLAASPAGVAAIRAALGAGAPPADVLAPGRRHPEVAPHYAELTSHLIENRSVQMAHRLFLPLRAGRVFVAVWALHLYGERGLLALLRDQGYRVRTVY